MTMGSGNRTEREGRDGREGTLKAASRPAGEGRKIDPGPRCVQPIDETCQNRRIKRCVGDLRLRPAGLRLQTSIAGPKSAAGTKEHRDEKRGRERRTVDVRVAVGAIAGTTGGPATYAIELVRALASAFPDDDWTVLTDRRRLNFSMPAAMADSLPKNLKRKCG